MEECNQVTAMTSQECDVMGISWSQIHTSLVNGGYTFTHTHIQLQSQFAFKMTQFFAHYVWVFHKFCTYNFLDKYLCWNNKLNLIGLLFHILLIYVLSEDEISHGSIHINHWDEHEIELHIGKSATNKIYLHFFCFLFCLFMKKVKKYYLTYFQLTSSTII